MTTEELLNQIARRELLTAEQLARLRAQVANSVSPVTPKALAKHLVDKGMLTLGQAQSLLTAAAEVPRPKPKPPSDDMGLAPLDELEELAPLKPVDAAPKPKQSPAAKSQPGSSDQLSELVELEELESLEPQPRKPAVRPTEPASRPTFAPKKPVATAATTEPSSLLDELDSLESASPLGGGSLDLLAGNAAIGAEGSPLLAPTKKKGLAGLFGLSEPKKRKKGESEFESPLMLFGGGALLLLVLLGVGVFFLYSRGSGDEQFKLAEDDYRSGSYRQAISKYTEYLEKFPTHPSASMAKVHRGLAKLRQATEHSTDFSHALEIAQSVVNEIADEKEFSEAKVEFRSLFPDIAEGLAKEATKQKDSTAVKAKLADAEKALALVMNTSYVPQAQRPVQRITAIREIMAIATRDLDRDADLAKTLDAMKQATEKRDIAAAYAARKSLLKLFPDLAGNESLAASMLAVAEGEKDAVRVAGDERPAENKESPSPVVAELALAARKTIEAGGESSLAALLVQGAVYGIDAGSGKVLWRRYVGVDSTATPLRVDAADGADVLVVDSVRHELVRLSSATGKLVWRQPIGESIANATVLAKQVVVSTRGGKLLAVDIKSGAVIRSAVLPQAVRIAAVVNPSADQLYQVGEQSSIYVLSDDLACQQASYLGHETGMVNVPPLVLPRHLIVAENRGAQSCVLHVLSMEADGKIGREVQKIELPGHVLTPPVMADRKLVVMTDSGHIKVMGINPSNAEQPLADLAEQPAAAGETSAMRHLLVDGGNLWIADRRLVRYKVQAAAGRLTPSALEDDYGSGSFEQPPVAVGKTLIHARRPTGAPTVLVTGTSLDDGHRLWETQVATSPAAEPVTEGGVAVVSATGQLFSVADDVWKQSALDEPATTDFEREPPVVLAARADLSSGAVVYSPVSSDSRVYILSPGKDVWVGHWLKSPEPLACAATALGKGLVAATNVGQVFWLNPANGKPVAAPFQVDVSAGSDVRWTRPDTTADGKELVISDGTRVYRVSLVREPAPHLEAVATSEELAESIVTPLAVLEAVAVAGDDGGKLRVFKLPDLTSESPIDLGGTVTWGPHRIGKHLFVATASDELICIDGSAKIVWRQSLEHRALVGTPALANDEVLASTSNGHVLRISLSDGSTLGDADLGQPLAVGPVRLDKRWLTIGRDGTLLVIETPASAADSVASGGDR